MSAAAAGLEALRAAMALGEGAVGRPGGADTFPILAGGANLNGIQMPPLSLLWRIRLHLRGATPVVLQFVPCTADDAADAVAYAFACATAAMLGRTLLINAHQNLSAEILPDAFTPRLYHQDLGGAALCATLARPDGTAPLNAALAMFRFLVIDQASPQSSDGGACAAAPFCTGTVLVVRAGATRLDSIKMAAGRIAAIGGTVLGTVLDGVPSWAAGA